MVRFKKKKNLSERKSEIVIEATITLTADFSVATNVTR